MEIGHIVARSESGTHRDKSEAGGPTRSCLNHDNDRKGWQRWSPLRVAHSGKKSGRYAHKLEDRLQPDTQSRQLLFAVGTPPKNELPY